MTRRTVHDLVAEAKAAIEELTAEQVKAELDAGTAMLVDIRDIRERVEKGVIPGAVSAPRGMLEFWFDPASPYHQERYTPEGRYIFHCASGWRSALGSAGHRRDRVHKRGSPRDRFHRLGGSWLRHRRHHGHLQVDQASLRPDDLRAHAGRHGAGSSGRTCRPGRDHPDDALRRAGRAQGCLGSSGRSAPADPTCRHHEARRVIADDRWRVWRNVLRVGPAPRRRAGAAQARRTQTCASSYLAPLCAGQVIAGVAFAHARRIGPAAVRATRVAGGWQFDGFAPWTTSWGIAQQFVIVGESDGRRTRVGDDRWEDGQRDHSAPPCTPESSPPPGRLRWSSNGFVATDAEVMTIDRCRASGEPPTASPARSGRVLHWE